LWYKSKEKCWKQNKRQLQEWSREDTKKKKENRQEPKTSSVDYKKRKNSTIHISALIITYNCIRKDTNQWEEFIGSQNTMLGITQTIRHVALKDDNRRAAGSYGENSEGFTCTESMRVHEYHQQSLKCLSFSREHTTWTADIGFWVEVNEYWHSISKPQSITHT